MGVGGRSVAVLILDDWSWFKGKNYGWIGVFLSFKLFD